MYTILTVDSGEATKKLPSADYNSVRRGVIYGNGAGNFYAGSLGQAVNATSAVSENIAAAAYASSPDPKVKAGWVFGGMSKSDWSFIRYPVTNDTLVAREIFYKIDMTSSQTAAFTALQAPPQLSTNPRAQGGLVWLPFGNQGILVAFGGVQYPADLYSASVPVQPTNNTYMSDLLIYDIAGSTWYSQSTLENGPRPSQLAGFCTAVVPTNDSFSQEIIVYGGSDGTGKNPASDDVWILSIPAFQWTYVKQSNNATHGRRGSVCFTPNPTTFITVGGTAIRGLALGSANSFADVLDLNTWTWTGKYDPSSSSAFTAPSGLVTQLNWPNSSGPGRTVVPSGVASSLSSVLNIRYSNPLPTNYPYASPSLTGSSTPTPTPSPPSKGKNIALIASLATVIPLVVIALIIGACIFLRKRKDRDNHTRDKRSEVSSWAGKIDRDEKSNFGTETTAVNSPYDDFGASPVIPDVQRKDNDIYEADHQNTLAAPARSPGHTSYGQGSQQYYEIMDHDPRGPTALSAHSTNVNSQQSDIRSELGSDKHASELPHASSRENLSVPSGGVVTGASQPSPISRKPVADRRESTPLPSPSTPNMGHTRGTSDVSSAILTASPNTDYRRSQHIDNLPDQPGLLGEGRSAPTTQGRSSVYKEKFDDK